MALLTRGQILKKIARPVIHNVQFLIVHWGGGLYNSAYLYHKLVSSKGKPPTKGKGKTNGNSWRIEGYTFSRTNTVGTWKLHCMYTKVLFSTMYTDFELPKFIWNFVDYTLKDSFGKVHCTYVWHVWNTPIKYFNSMMHACIQITLYSHVMAGSETQPYKRDMQRRSKVAIHGKIISV